MRTNQAVLTKPAFQSEIRAHLAPYLSRRMISRGAIVVFFSPNEFRFVLLLLVKLNCIVSNEMIVEQLWGDRIDGGPDEPRKTIDVMKYNIRQKLNGSGLGLSLGSIHGRGSFLIDESIQ